LCIDYAGALKKVTATTTTPTEAAKPAEPHPVENKPVESSHSIEGINMEPKEIEAQPISASAAPELALVQSAVNSIEVEVKSQSVAVEITVQQPEIVTVESVETSNGGKRSFIDVSFVSSAF
jgi:hypothetical protein